VSRTRKHLIRFAAVGLLVSALAFAGATPALAFGPADVTVTPSTTGENPLTTVAVVCPSPADTMTLSWTGTLSGAPASYGGGSQALDGAGEFSADYYFESFFDRDTDATLSLECFDGVTSLGTDVTVYHLPTTGAVSSTPASRAANADLIATGNCGTAASIVSVSTYAYTQPGAVLIAGFPVTTAYTGVGNYSINLGTPASLGVSAGTSVLVQVICTSSAPTSLTTSIRSSTTLVSAAVAAPAAPALAASGSDTALPLGLGAALLAAGGVLLLARRRRIRLN
jgi:hypothetical protein